MQYSKLNVLHLHLSDMGRIAWESLEFPELNVGYDTDTRYWTQAEVRALVAYGRTDPRRTGRQPADAAGGGASTTAPTPR